MQASKLIFLHDEAFHIAVLLFVHYFLVCIEHMPPGPMVLRIACDEQYYNQDDFLHWYGRVRAFGIWEEAGNCT